MRSQLQHKCALNVHLFFLAITFYSKIQALAQAELNCIVSTDWLLTLANRVLLPHIDMLAKELLQHYPAIL
jgi:hypothetical protein